MNRNEVLKKRQKIIIFIAGIEGGSMTDAEPGLEALSAESDRESISCRGRVTHSGINDVLRVVKK
ncbi:MAG: hypothetical protein PHR47_01930 [Candidatus Pacebacteria bacterium]|nr:hypothetical protein [Candidatus Paceibacterota bacterium]